jgi:hypothetical protein
MRLAERPLLDAHPQKSLPLSPQLSLATNYSTIGTMLALPTAATTKVDIQLKVVEEDIPKRTYIVEG